MSRFYMLAGTLQSFASLEALQRLLKEASIVSRLIDDELEVEMAASMAIRTGFAHEYILVGDSRDAEILITAAKQLSAVFNRQRMSHDYEIYDRDNQLIESYQQLF